MVNTLEHYGSGVKIPENLPVLPLRDTVVFPKHILPLFIGRKMSMKAVAYAIKTDKLVFLTAQRQVNIESPVVLALFSTGTIGLILRMMRVTEQGDKMKVLVQGLCKGRIRDFTQIQPFFRATVEKEEEKKSDINTAEAEHLIVAVKEKVDKLIFSHGKTFPTDILVVIENLEDSEKLAHLIAANIGLDVAQAQEILEIGDPTQKLIRVGEILDEEINILRGGR